MLERPTPDPSRGHVLAQGPGIAACFFLVPLLHPLLMPVVGVASHLLWFTHVLPVATWSYRSAGHRGGRGARAVAGVTGALVTSLALLVAGERLLGGGYGVAAPWQTIGALGASTALSNALVAGFALFAAQARETYETLFDHAPFGILRVASDGTVRLANRQARAWLSIDPQATRFADLGDYLLADTDGAGVPWARPTAGESIALRTQRRPVRRLVASSVRHADGDWQVVLRDETARVQLEMELRQAQKLEAIGRFATTVAHDFNNMLSAILLSNEMTLEVLPRASEGYALAHETRRAAERAVVLTRRILTFGRAGEADLRILDVGAVVQEVGPMLRRLVRRNVHLHLAAPTGLPTVRADRGHLEQILLNLVVNASDAMPSGGAIDVRLAVAGESLVLSVSDTGVGMDEATRQRIFEPFFTTKGDGRGTGLGLATVATLVERARGSIEVQSQRDRGTTFTVRLPIDGRAAEPDDDDHAIGGGEHGRELVLVVDDDEDVRSLAARALRSRGYLVVEARRARDAIEYVSSGRRRPDLIVTDVAMPDMDGPTLLATLASRGMGLPAVLMSAHLDVSQAADPAVGTIGAVLTKPFSGRALAAAVRDALDEAAATTRTRQAAEGPLSPA